MTIQATPHIQSFDWDIREDGQLELARPERGIWLACGLASDVLWNDVSHGLYESKKWHNGEFVDCVACAQMPPLWRLGEMTGLRRLEGDWRPLAGNPVLHKAFGPAVTAASDGVHVVLLSGLTLCPDWMLVHIGNVIGPVTATPTAPWSWCGKSKICPTQEDERSLRKRHGKRYEELLASL